MEDGQIFMPPKEFALKLGTQEQKVRRWLREGFIKGKKVSRSWLVLASEINRLVDDMKEIKNQEETILEEQSFPTHVDKPTTPAKSALGTKNTDFQELLRMLEKKMGKKLLQDKWQCYKDDYAEDDATIEDLRKLKKEFVTKAAEE